MLKEMNFDATSKKIEKDYSRRERKDDLARYHPNRVVSSVSVM